MWGPLATVNTYRFSSKEVDLRTGQYYYGYRYYEPNLQRWLNQDPIEEQGGINLYAYVGNNPINTIDPSGLFGADPWTLPPSSYGSQINSVPYVTGTISPGNMQLSNNDSPKEIALMVTGGAAAVGAVGAYYAGPRLAPLAPAAVTVCKFAKKHWKDAVVSGLGALAIFEKLKDAILPPNFEEKANTPEEQEEPHGQPTPNRAKTVPLPGSIPYPAPRR